MDMRPTSSFKAGVAGGGGLGVKPHVQPPPDLDHQSARCQWKQTVEGWMQHGEDGRSGSRSRPPSLWQLSVTPASIQVGTGTVMKPVADNLGMDAAKGRWNGEASGLSALVVPNGARGKVGAHPVGDTN